MCNFLKALQIFFHLFSFQLVVERNSRNAISWVSSLAEPPWRFQFLFNEIRVFSSISQELHHVARSTNGFADFLAMQGVDRSLPFGACNFFLLSFFSGCFF